MAPRRDLMWKFSVILAGLTFCGLSLFSQTLPPQVRPENELSLRIVVVGSQEAAERLLQRLAQGEDFVALAKAESLDPSAAAGGLLGRLAPAALRPELRSALQGIKPGQVTPVVRIPTGFAILQVLADDGIPTSPSPAALSSTGSVKYAFDVGGFAEATASLQGFAKPPDWNQDLQTICGARNASLGATRSALEKYFSPAYSAERAREPLFNRLQVHIGLGQLYAYSGEMAKAIEQFEAAYLIAKSSIPDTLLQMEVFLGIAHLHKAELDNEIYQNPGDRCLLQVGPHRPFEKNADSQSAVRHFLNYLERKPDEIEVKWLLNLGYMTLGTYPDAVPASLRIDPAAFTSSEDPGRFVDVAAQKGFTETGLAGGVVIEDLDNDGLLDVVL